MEYRVLKESEAFFLTNIFSTPEYDLYFAENNTTEEEWKDRLALFETKHSYVVSKDGVDIGWIMYELIDGICDLDIVVLLPSERCNGYGKEIENYLSKIAISLFVKKEIKRQCAQYQLFPDFIKKYYNSFESKKVIFANEVKDYITKENSSNILDLKKQIQELYNKIESWNL